MRKHMRLWGMSDYVVAIRAIGVPLADSTKQRAAIRERFVNVGRESSRKPELKSSLPWESRWYRCDYSAAEMAAEIGVPVLDALAAGIQTAEVMVRMGITHSLKAILASVHKPNYSRNEEKEWHPVSRNEILRERAHHLVPQ